VVVNVRKATPRTVGETVRFIRGDKSQKVFAEILGISQPYLCRIENDNSEPGKKVIVKLVEISGFPAQTFFKGAS
jgi:transcriptional regulator with XRE-family HTH domain